MDKKEFTKEEIEIIHSQMQQLQAKYPDSQVVLNLEQFEVIARYKLPEDFKQIQTFTTGEEF